MSSKSQTEKLTAQHASIIYKFCMRLSRGHTDPTTTSTNIVPSQSGYVHVWPFASVCRYSFVYASLFRRQQWFYTWSSGLRGDIFETSCSGYHVCGPLHQHFYARSKERSTADVFAKFFPASAEETCLRGLQPSRSRSGQLVHLVFHILGPFRVDILAEHQKIVSSPTQQFSLLQSFGSPWEDLWHRTSGCRRTFWLTAPNCDEDSFNVRSNPWHLDKANPWRARPKAPNRPTFVR